MTKDEEWLERKKADNFKKEWQGLSDEKLLKLLKSIDQSTERLPMGFKLFAHAIDDELKELNS